MNRSKLAKLVAVSSIYLLAGGTVSALAQSSAAPSSAVNARASTYGETIRSSHWSAEGASHAQIGQNMQGSVPPPAALGSGPPVTIPTAAGFGLTTAASHGGLGTRGHGR